MKKLLCAVLMTAGMFAMNTSNSSAVAAGSAIEAAPSDAPEWGGCRWQCSSTGTWYQTSSACNTACSSSCEQIC